MRRARKQSTRELRVQRTACERHTLVSHGPVGETLLTFPGARVISTPPGTSGLLAFEMEWDNDGYDTIKRWPRRPPQAAFVPLLASRYPRDGSDPRPLCGCRDIGHAR